MTATNLPDQPSGDPAAAGPGDRSQAAYRRALEVFPDGTTRISIERDPAPRYISRGEGAYLWDLDGQRFLDLGNNYTTLIHGHGFRPVVEAVTARLADGACFANPTEGEIDLAALLCARVPGLERLRFMNSGTEAVLFAIKAARAYSGRPGIAKIEGAYHGAYDWVEVGQASHAGNWGDPDAPAATPFYRGVPQSVLDEVLVLRFNDAEGARRHLATHAGRLACLLIDPMPSRAGLIPPDPDFVEAIQESCRRHGILLVADEVLNFRQSYAGASHRHGLRPDLFALGKIIGGGLPIGAVGGSVEAMSVFDGRRGRPALPQGGTFSANPLSMAAGHAAMAALDHQAFARLERLGDQLRAGLTAAIERHAAPFCVTGAASLFRIHPRRGLPRDLRDSDPSPVGVAALAALSRHFERHGVLLPRATCASLSTPMTDTEVRVVIELFDDFLAANAALCTGLEDASADD